MKLGSSQVEKAGDGAGGRRSRLLRPRHPFLELDPMTKQYLRGLIVIVAAALVVSGIAPFDRTTGWLEIFPGLIAGPVVVLTARRSPSTRLTYPLLAIHALALILVA